MEDYVENPITLLKDNENYLLNNYQGTRDTVGIGGTITGKGADVIILDDPLKASDSKSKRVNMRTNQFIGETLISRFNKTSEEKVLILIQQRLKEDELAGRMFADEYDLAIAVIEAIESRAAKKGLKIERFHFSSI